MPIMAMVHDVDPAKLLLDQLGDISEHRVTLNQLLCAVYIRPEKTQTGFILPDSYRDEDKYQGKACLVVAMGPDAFVDTEKWSFQVRAKVGDWIMFRPSDGFNVTMPSKTKRDGVLCRMLDDIHMRMIIPHPDAIW